MDTVTYLDGEMGVTEKIKRSMYDVCRQFVYIGFLLREVRDYEYFKEKDYSDVYDYAQQELGFKKSSVKNFIAVSDTFCAVRSGVECMQLADEFERFNYSQLCEMLSMSPPARALVDPDMTVKQIREIKKETSGQTSGQVHLFKSQSVQVTLSDRVYNKLCEYSVGSGIAVDIVVENALDNYLLNLFDSMSV